MVGGHNYQFSYTPPGHSPEPEHVLSTGAFPLNLVFKLLVKNGVFKSSMEDNATPLGDIALHVQTWEKILAWPIRAWTTAHDPVKVCGPDASGKEIKELIRASLARTDELDPTGQTYKGKVLSQGSET